MTATKWPGDSICSSHTCSWGLTVGSHVLLLGGSVTFAYVFCRQPLGFGFLEGFYWTNTLIKFKMQKGSTKFGYILFGHLAQENHAFLYRDISTTTMISVDPLHSYLNRSGKWYDLHLSGGVCCGSREGSGEEEKGSDHGYNRVSADTRITITNVYPELATNK